MEPEDVHFRSAEHLIGEDENEKTLDRKEDGEESRKAGRPPLSRIPTFQSSLARKRVTVQSAESSPKMDGSSQPGQKERAGPTEPGRLKLQVTAGRETALPVPSARLHTSPADVFSPGDILDPLPLRRDYSLDQTPEITVDSDRAKQSLQRPPLRNLHEFLVASDLLTEPVSEFETASGETVSEDEEMSTQDAAVEDLSSCSSVDHHETFDEPREDALKEDLGKGSEKGRVNQSQFREERGVTEEDVKPSSVPHKVDGGICSAEDNRAKTQKPSDSKDSEKCLKEARQPTKAEQKQPTKAEQEQPTKAEQEQPNKAEQQQPTKAEQQQPTKAEQEQPTKAKQQQPTKAEPRQPTKAETRQLTKVKTQQENKADTTHAKRSETRMYTPSKQTKGRSCAVCFLLPSVLLLLGGFGLHVWQYGIPKSVSHLMSQLELHWLESFWMPQETCVSDCRFSLVESVPEGVYFPAGSPHLPSISDAWTNLLNRANRSAHIAAFYFTLRDTDLGLTEPSSVLGKKVFDQLKQLQPKGVKLKIAVNAPQPYIADTDELEATGAQVRAVDLQSITGGILHTKLWVVDKKHMFLGSANMDWRSLTQVKEVGVSVEDCSCLAQDASRIFDLYWDIGAQKNASIPPFWPGRFSALSSSKYPLAVKFNGVPARVYLSSSPPALSSSGRSDDLTSILEIIADAKKFIYVSVMDYLPMSQFTKPDRFWPVIDSALREAACARGVEVKLLVSCWSHSPGAMSIFLQSLSVLSKPPLSCNIHTKVFEVPSTREQQRIPFARVNHAKYMVTDRVVYIGTSNWSENYFTQTAGVGLVVNQTGSAVRQGQQTVQSQLQNIFQRDWHSQYAQTLSDVHAERCSGIKLT